MLFLYTDGVNEAMNEAGECFGTDKLCSFLEKKGDMPPRKFCDALNREITEWRDGAEVSDDITMMALRYGTKPIRIDSIIVPSGIDQIGSVLDFISNVLAIYNCSERLLRRVLVCVEEVYVNISSYAFTSLRSTIEVMYEVDDPTNQLIITFIDKGKPFDPVSYETYDEQKERESLHAGGEGIHLVKKLSKNLTYKYDDGRNMTSIYFDLEFK